MMTSTLVQMGFQRLVESRLSTCYERLIACADEVKAARSPRRRSWVRKTNGRFRGLRLMRSRKLNWKAFSVMILPRRIAGIYAAIENRLKMDGGAGAHPAIVFCGQWGLPVLSHPNANCRKSAISFVRKPGFTNDIVFAK